jgi:hypothetical protein
VRSGRSRKAKAKAEAKAKAKEGCRMNGFFSSKDAGISGNGGWGKASLARWK